ncbi:MAG: hypothetical protein AAGF24_14295 [Cyanobacteria bacterium P01_H01_bin.121]
MRLSLDWSIDTVVQTVRQRASILALSIAVSMTGWAVNGPEAIAQTDAQSEASSTPAEDIFTTLVTLPSIYDIGIAYRRDLDPSWPTVEDGAPSPIQLTPPSLWWNRDQIISRWGGFRLTQGWFAFRSESTQLNVIDVQVDGQYWRALQNSKQWHLAQQYAVLSQFGTTATSYGYQLRLYQQSTMVGIYACDLRSVPEFNQPTITEISADQLGDLDCHADIGPFVVTAPPVLDGGDLFSPPSRLFQGTAGGLLGWRS